MKEVAKFVCRLQKIGINVTVSINYPWVYLESINDNEVVEKRMSNHHFTLCFLPIVTNRKVLWCDLSETFKLIKKYGKRKNSN
ncbi:MAG: hypothetical protein RIR48_1347 [Bacteroidota bacterium]|jgi:hypothetical protein